MIIKCPIKHLLYAIHFDPSAFDKDSFHLEVFAMALFVPHDHISLLFGERIEIAPYGWKLSRPDLVARLQDKIETVALPYIAAIGTLDAFADVMLSKHFTNPHVPHAIAFALALAGQHDRAIAVIDGFLPEMGLTREWERRIFDQCTAFRDLLVRDPDAADRQLLAWEEYTVQQLKLTPFR